MRASQGEPLRPSFWAGSATAMVEDGGEAEAEIGFDFGGLGCPLGVGGGNGGDCAQHGYRRRGKMGGGNVCGDEMSARYGRLSLLSPVSLFVAVCELAIIAGSLRPRIVSPSASSR